MRDHYLILVLGLCASSSALGETPRVCDLATKHGGLVPYVVKVEPNQDGSRTIKADFDLDGADDELRWLVADSARLTLTLSSNHKSFALEQQRLNVVEFESRYYVVTTRAESELGPWYRDVLAVNQKGITTIC